MQQAKNELLEETGYQAEQVIEIYEYFPDPGLNTQSSKIFIALNAKNTYSQNLDNTEDIQVKKVATDSLDTLIEQREICDALTISQVFLLKKYLTSHLKRWK